ncbi:hypothetical protein [Dyella choica]|uniref:Uncharacterized protein n=1 Tax=Dyella choica TaxID=1927959 RepID=A0A3S0RHX1_9GAMM|nr:hypothetical protein [Dyella choica]RUL70534.1 hypothetical protein EKH80_20290 [Dyella choica]
MTETTSPSPDLDAAFKTFITSVKTSSSRESIRTAQAERTWYEQSYLDNDAERRKHREKITPALLWICQGWVAAVVLLLFLEGFGTAFNFFTLSPNVVIALLATTTANILGLFAIALRYLYSDHHFQPISARKPPAGRNPREKGSQA